MIEVQEKGIITWLIFNHPPVNVLDCAFMEVFCKKVEELKEAPIGALCIRGEGKAFSAGASVEEHKPEKVKDLISLLHQGVRLLWDFPAPVFIFLHGYCLGGGLELALGGDVLIADPEAKLGQPEITLSFFPPMGSLLLPRFLPPAVARDLIFTGRMLSAEEALRFGLVSRILPKEKWQEVEEEIQKLSLPVLQLAKKALRDTFPFPEKPLATLERLFLEDLYRLEDVHEGIQAFLEKRKPQWKHR